MNLKVGTDPEVFLRNKKSGMFESAAGRFPGTKDKPFEVDKGAIQVDGLALEFNIHPAETEDEFNDNIQTVINQLNEEVLKVDRDLELVFVPYAEFDLEYFKKIPKEYKILGCDADFECFGGKKNPTPNYSNSPFRTTAGHVHVGYTEGENPQDAVHKEDCRFIAHYFHTKTRTFPPRTFEEKTRLLYYGVEGAFRPKSYGVELRKFSNLWVRTPADRKKMFRFIKDTMNKINEAVQ